MPSTPNHCLLAHDLNNQLMVILAHCSVLEQSPMADELGRHIHVIHEVAQHMAADISRQPCPMVETWRARCRPDLCFDATGELKFSK
jgi:hypothetical protein